MGKLDNIKKINKNIIHDDGTIDSFELQLIDLFEGNFDVRKPLIISEDTNFIDYVPELGNDKPLVMNVSTVIKLKEKHNLDLGYVARCKELLKNSVLAFQSPKFNSSIIFLLKDYDNQGNPIISICRVDKMAGNICVNEITSIYNREHFESYIEKAFQENCTFYKNKKTDQYFSSALFQVKGDLKIALSKTYSKNIFNKSQVKKDFVKEEEMNLWIKQNI